MKVLLPIFILLAAASGVGALLWLKPEADVVAPERPVTQVEVLTVQPETIRLSIRSQGTVLPRTETALSVEVSGRIVEMADAFRAGGYFEEGDLLFRIDPADYEAARAARAAELANAELALAREQALADQAAADWKSMGDGEASDLTLRKPQMAQATAAVESAAAALAKAARDLARTEVRAPYDGRVLSKSVDLGQYVAANPASPVARIYATDQAEIRLPLTEREAELIETRTREIKPVRIFAGNDAEKLLRVGRFARLEGTIDPESRLLYAVAVIDDPFAPAPPDGEALRRGQFVTAEIQARSVPDAYRLPRYALRGSSSVYLLTGDGSLETREVDVLQSDPESVIVTDGLKPGDRIATSPIAYFVEGMPVEVVESSDSISDPGP